MLQFWAQLNIFSLAKFSISLCSVRMQENADQNHSEYGHFSCSVSIIHFSCLRPFDTHLKLVSAIFIKFLFFHQMIAFQKLWKILFISSKELFSFLTYSNVRISVLPFFLIVGHCFIGWSKINPKVYDAINCLIRTQ